jgi:phosphoribosylformylglycinamidine synthase II
MSAYEMMLSESQERMLAVLKPGREARRPAHLQEVGPRRRHHRLHHRHRPHGAQAQGRDRLPTCRWRRFDDAPLYDRPWTAPATLAPLRAADVAAPSDYAAAILKLMSAPDMASKRWIWEQYDRHVMADTLEDSSTGADAGIVRVHGTRKALAVTSDVTPRYVLADPYEGGKQAVAEAWRNLISVGAEPIAITDNLNFGNPERPEIMGQIVRAIEGMAEACRELDFPVVSGNVSLYNETNGAAIPPTPTVGGVGLLKDSSIQANFGGLKAGEALILIGETKGELGASMYLREILGREEGAPPPVDLALERRTGDLVRGLIQGGLRTVHDLSDGGLIAAVVEMALASKVGVTLAALSDAPHAALFAEDQARYLVAAADPAAILAAAAKAGVPAAVIGHAGGEAIACSGLFDLPLSKLREANEGWMPAYMGG